MQESEASHTHYHTNGFDTGSERPLSDLNMTNSSPSETIRESSIMDYAEDEDMAVSEDEESQTTEGSSEDFEMTDEESERADEESDEESEDEEEEEEEEESEDEEEEEEEEEDEEEEEEESEEEEEEEEEESEEESEEEGDEESDGTSSTESDTTSSSKEDVEETNEEIVKRVEEFLVSEGLIQAGTVNCQVVSSQLPDVKINSTIAKEYIILDKICEIYHCDKVIPFIRYSKTMIQDTTKEECLLPDKGCKEGKELVYDCNQTRHAKKSNNLDKKVQFTDGMSSRQENRKEGALSKTSAKLVHKKNTTVDNSNTVKINKFEVNKIMEGMNPTQEPMYSCCKSLSVDSVGKCREGTPVLPKPVANAEALVSQKEKKNINTTIEAGAGSVHQAPTGIKNECFEVIDLTKEDDLPFVEPVSGANVVVKSTATASKAVGTTLARNTLVGKYERQILASETNAKPTHTNPVKNTIPAGQSAYVDPNSETVKKQYEVGVGTSDVLPATSTTHRPQCSCHKSSLVDTNTVLGKSGDSTPVLPKPVTSTKMLVSKEQSQPIKEQINKGQINSAMGTSQGTLLLTYKPLLGGDSTPALPKLMANTEALVSQKEKNNINTTIETRSVHQAPTSITNGCSEVIDLTKEDYLPFVDPASRIDTFVKNTATAGKAVDTTLPPNTLVGKYERQILASETNPAKNTIPAGQSISTSTHVDPNSETVNKQSEVGVGTSDVLPATSTTQRPKYSCHKSSLVDTNNVLRKSGDSTPVLPKPVTNTKTIVSKEQNKPIIPSDVLPPVLVDTNNVLGKNGDSTAELPKPVTNTKTLVSKEQHQPIKEQIKTAMGTSQGTLLSTYKPSLGGESTPVLPKPMANTEVLVSQKEKKNINTTIGARSVHQAPTDITNESSEVIDLTKEDDLPFVEPVLSNNEGVKNTSSKAVDTILTPNTVVGKYERQILASETNPKPAPTNPVKNMITPAKSPAGTSTYMAPNTKTGKRESDVGVAMTCALPEKRKRMDTANTVTAPQSVGPGPLQSPVTHNNVCNRERENKVQNIWQVVVFTFVDPDEKQ